MAIRVCENVRFKIVPVEMLDMFYAILNAAAIQGCEPVITGASYENYPKGKVHDRGYAIDIRVFDIPDQKLYADTIRLDLRTVSPYYVVLYGDPKHRNHIHIGFSWWFSIDERRRREHGECENLELGDQLIADHSETFASGDHTVDQGFVRG